MEINACERKQVKTRLESCNYQDPERICETFRNALLRLGVACLNGGHLTLRLTPGLHAEDYKYLRRILRNHALPNRIRSAVVDCQPIIKIEDFDGSVLYRFQTISLELFNYRSPMLIQERREVSFMTGPDSHSIGSTLEGFLKTAYGAKVPVNLLEAGIALFVKCLGSWGCRSSMSCTGHATETGITSPRVWLFGRYHLYWLQHILTELFGEYSVSKTWSFTYSPTDQPKRTIGYDREWASGVFQAHPDWTDRSAESRREYRRVLEDLHSIAKRMLDPDLAEHFRSRKEEWAKDFARRFVKTETQSPEQDHRIAS